MFRNLFLAAICSLMPLAGVRADEPAAPKATANRLSAESLPDFLTKLGYKVEAMPTEIGAPISLVSLDKDGWDFTIEVTVNAEGGLVLVAPLVKAPSDQAASAKMLNLLEANAVLGPCAFTYRAADGRICMRTQAQPSETSLTDAFAVLTEKIRLTHSIWTE